MASTFTRMLHASRLLILLYLCLQLPQAVAQTVTRPDSRTDTGSCKGTLYLTLDVGNMRNAERIAGILRQEQIKASFFLANNRTERGDHVLDDSWQQYWKARVAEGHVFGNHTWSHHFARKDLDNGKLYAVSRAGKAVYMDKKSFCRELTEVDTAFHHLTGQHLSGLWRAPAGRTTQQSIRWAGECGYPVHVGWTHAGYLGDDTSSKTYPNQVLLKRALANIRSGDILLMHLGIHDRKQDFVDVLPELLRGLKQKGFCFSTLRMGDR